MKLAFIHAIRRGRVVLFLSAMLALGSSGFGQADKPPASAPYRDAKLPVEQRVADLLSRMTLEEKIAQMSSVWENPAFFSDMNPPLVDQKLNFLPERAAVTLKNGLGEFSRPGEGRGPRASAEFTNTVQKWVKENTRLGIPLLFHDECLHGHVGAKATSFPAAIGLASTWDPALLHDVFTAMSAETRAAGVHHCLAPVLDLARDPRWGRTEETYGEDPYLVTRIGVAAINGFQGTGPLLDKVARVCDGKTFCRARAAGRRHERCAGKLFRARDSRILAEAI